MTGLVLFGSLIVFLVIGVPISVSLGAATMLSLISFGVPMAVVPQRMFTALDSVSIMAIPLFVLAGNLMTKGGISRRLVDFCNSVIGNVRGGMAYAMVLACAFFAALSGSAPATVLAIGSMLYPDMVRLGYPRERCAGLLAVAGGLGPIIPPSIIMVVYCTITNSSVGDMFKGGITAGIMIAVVLAGISIYYAHKEQWPKNTEKIFGTFLEGIATCVLLVPVLWPIAQSLGIGAIHFGMVVCMANVIGCMTPPVAVNLFAAASVSKLKMGEIAKGELPFFLGYCVVFFMIVLIPALSTLLL